MNRPMDPDVEAAIEIAYMVEKTGNLPLPGGLFAQDSMVMWLLKHVYMAQLEAERVRLERSKSQL